MSVAPHNLRARITVPKTWWARLCAAARDTQTTPSLLLVHAFPPQAMPGQQLLPDTTRLPSAPAAAPAPPAAPKRRGRPPGTKHRPTP